MSDGEPDYGAMVNALLSDQKVTAYEMAKRADLTQQAILDITKGKRPNPRIGTIRKLLAASGKPWAWIDDWVKERCASVGSGSGGSEQEPANPPEASTSKRNRKT
jgi:transcriptional regulator with XRE-family HTH domain